MIKKSNTIPTEPIQVLTCCSSSGKAKVEKILRRYHPRVRVSEHLNGPGQGYTVTVLATEEAVAWVEYLLCHAGLRLLSQPYDPANMKFYLQNQSLDALKEAHEALHTGMPVAWSDPKYKPPPQRASPKHKRNAQPKTQMRAKRKPGRLDKFLKDWL